METRCLIHNWQEDQVALEHRLKDFVAKREGGKLAVTATAARLGAQTVPIALRSAEPESSPHYGDVVLLRSVRNGGVLALSLAEIPAAVTGDHRKLHCAPLALAGASARSAFQVLSYDGKAGPICYDDKLVLLSAGDLYGDKAVGFVHSESPPVGSQASDQRVTLCVMPALAAAMPYASAFTILPERLDARLGLRGQPVGPSDAFALVHAQSGRRLAGLGSRVRTDFGLEFALGAQTFLTKGSVHQLAGEHKGTRHLTGYGVKPEFSENLWDFVRASEPARPAPREPAAEEEA